MKRKHKVWAASCAVLLMTTALIYAYSTGPDPRHTGAPGDDPAACTSAGCHVGTQLNAGGGDVSVTFPNGSTYTPGQQQTFTVKVTDPTARVYGFQLTARLASSPSNGQAGDLASSTGEIVICDDSSTKGARGCPSNAQVQFIEHSTPSSSGTWRVLWTPPANNVGDINIYVAGNGANGNANETGDHIYTAHYTLSASVAGPKPTITSAGIVSASGFNAKAGLTSGTWLEIYGSNLSTTTRGWQGSDFKGANAPTTLDGVTVTINGKPAFIDLISPGQINAQAPEDPATGPVEVVVSNANGSSDPVIVQKAAIAPALLSPAAFNVGGKQYVTALYTDGTTFVGKAGLISGLSFRPAKAGDTIIFYGIGFGPVTPATPAGTIAAGANSLQSKPNFRFGEVPATLTYYGLAPGFVGLFQFNVVVPNTGGGDQQLNVDVGGVPVNQNLFITTQ